MITLSLAELSALNPCDLDNRRLWFGVAGRKRLNVTQALKAGATISDILWVSVKIGRKDLCVQFALLCAQRVAHLSADPRVQQALNAAQAWINNPSPNAYAAYAPYAAYATYAAYAANANAAANAAYAANAAAYATYAAYAAYAAANAAAYAASAAAYAASAAAYDAYDANAAAYAAVARRVEEVEQKNILILVMSGEYGRLD